MLKPIQDIIYSHLQTLREAEEAPVSDGILRSRASSAGKCARSIGFSIAGLPASNPPSGDSLINFYLGDSIHAMVQDAIKAQYPDAQSEVDGSIGDFIVGHCDLLYTAEDGLKVVNEIKTVSDFAFELATGATLKSNGRWRKKERVVEGPKREHKLQVGIYAEMLGADYVAITYIRKTAAKDEPVAWEWRFKTSDISFDALVELNRQRQIVWMVRNNRMPDREFEGKIIVNPNAVKWPCGYCNHRDACIELGPGEVIIK